MSPKQQITSQTIAIMDRTSYTDMRTLVGTRLQWLANIGENNKGVNGTMVLEWMDTVLDKMNELEEYLHEKKQRLKAKRAEEKKMIQDSELQLEQGRIDIARLQGELDKMTAVVKDHEQRYPELSNDVAEMWDMVQHQAQEIIDKGLKKSDLTRKTARKIARLECEVVRQSEEAERLSGLLQTSESTSAARQVALSKAVADIRGLRSQSHRARITATRDLEAANKKAREADIYVEKLRDQLQLERESHESTVRSLQAIHADEVKKLRDSLAGEQVANKRSLQKAEQENAEIERLRGLLEYENEAHASTAQKLQAEREAGTKAEGLCASLIEERSANLSKLKEAESTIGEANAEIERLKKMIVEDRTKRLVREANAYPQHLISIPFFSQYPSEDQSGDSNVISWPSLPGPLAERLQRFRLTVSAPSTMRAEDIMNSFVKACEQEVVADRLGHMLSKARIEDWYCFNHVCQYGVRDDRSKAPGGSCRHHQSCLLIRRPLIEGNNILCRGVKKLTA
ncbi:hypothetical protein F4815DRAFT_457259 [Daldinia loculata]|nr:hypothetical protein F4815DRAFT_457259 [Daldinia loculata]